MQLQPELGLGVSILSSFGEGRRKTWKAGKQLPRKTSDEEWIEGVPMNQIPLCGCSHHVLTFLCQATRSSHRGTPCPLLRTHAAQFTPLCCPCRLSLTLKAAPQMQRREVGPPWLPLPLHSSYKEAEDRFQCPGGRMTPAQPVQALPASATPSQHFPSSREERA